MTCWRLLVRYFCASWCRPDRKHSVGAQLVYLRPYSPDLNPIEPAFAKLTAPSRQSKTASPSYLITSQ